MTGKERISNILQHKPTDRIGLFEHFWGDTHRAWTSGEDATSEIKPGEGFEDHFNYDLTTCWCFNLCADLDFVSYVVAEDDDTVTVKDGNYATLRRHKKHDSTPEHIAFDIDCREKWDELIKPKLLDPANFRRRINFEAYRGAKAYAASKERFFFWSGVNVFECMHPVSGHVGMLIAMLDDPEWLSDMTKTFAELTVELQKILFEEEGKPDGVWYYEDMGFKNAPFMSPAMYEEFIYPAHKYTCDYAHGIGLPVVMHSCGFVEPLLPGMIRAGIDGLQVIEVKAGMDLLRIFKNHGDKIALIGGIDVRCLYSNDRAIIDAELEAKIPVVKQGYAYVLHSDHSIPKTVRYETYKYFIEKGLALGSYN